MVIETQACSSLQLKGTAIYIDLWCSPELPVGSARSYLSASSVATRVLGSRVTISGSQDIRVRASAADVRTRPAIRTRWNIIRSRGG